jgi:hypothetical protein
MAKRMDEIRQEARSSCYQDRVEVYGIFVDDVGALRKRFLGEGGDVGEEVLGAYVKGLDGFYSKHEFGN